MSAGASGPPLPPLLGPGATLGRYSIVRFLAEGGMGQLFLARAAGLAGFEKKVALKRIRPELARNAELVQMFLAEARLAASLDFTNIVQVFDVGEQDGEYFFAMEYIAGSDVRAILTTARRLGRKIPLEAALSIGAATAAALHHAHEQRIVHRDVSPSNVLVKSDGHVKVTDFGIAKAYGNDRDTRSGSPKGKLSYMSPEQCRNQPLDRRSDVFAIGTMLWELTTGDRLFSGDSDFLIMDAIVSHDAPSPSTRVPRYPPALERIVMHALARDRDARYATALDLQRELEGYAYAAGLSISALDLARSLDALYADSGETWREQNAGDRFPVTSSIADRGDVRSRTSTARTELATASVKRRRWIALVATVAAVAGLAAVAGAWTLIDRADRSAAPDPPSIAPDNAPPQTPAAAAAAAPTSQAPVAASPAPTASAVDPHRPGPTRDVSKPKSTKSTRRPTREPHPAWDPQSLTLPSEGTGSGTIRRRR